MPTYKDIKIAVAVFATVWYWIVAITGKNEYANLLAKVAKMAISQ